MEIIVIGVNTSDPRSIMGPVEDVYREFGLRCEVSCYDSSDLDNEPLKYQELLRKTRTADLIILRCMTDPSRFKKFDLYEPVLKESKGFVLLYSGNADVRLSYRDMFKGSDEQYIQLCAYIQNKGFENDRGLILWLNHVLGGPDIEVPEPLVQRTDGIYHPDFDIDVSFEEYLKHLDTSRSTIGLMFVGTQWIYRNVLHIDALIRKIESEGMNVIPVFFSASTYKTENSKGTAAYAERYFMDGDRSRIDVLIMNTPFSQLVNSRDSLGARTPDNENFYKTMMDVPVLQAMQIVGKYSDYESTKTGLDKIALTSHVAWPEMDGQIITVPISHSEPNSKKLRHNVPIEDRIEHLVKVAKNWATIRHTPVKDRKIAILMYQSRPDSGRIGSAAGLDGVESVNDILKELQKKGYTLDHVPENGKALIRELLEGVTNDLNWTPSSKVSEKAVGLVDKRSYLEHFDCLSDFNKNAMIDNWGQPVGDICVDDGKIVIPGTMNGNIFIGYQPLRSWADQVEALYHDPEVVMPHQYLEYYRWLEHDFKANAVVHIGTHGTLEWLPGKNVGLSEKCYPDVVLNGMLDVYPYVIDDPGEGIQAKRRAEAVLIGHMCPTMARAGSYEDLAHVEVPLQEYFKFKLSMSDERKNELISEVFESAKEISLLNDLGISEDMAIEEFSEHLGEIHDYITDVKDAIIRDGLHILGRAPEEERLDETIYSLTRLRNGDIPSFRYSVGHAMGFDLESLLGSSTELNDNGELNSILIEKIDHRAQELLHSFRELNYDLDGCLALLSDDLGNIDDDLKICVRYICDTLSVNVKKMTEEMDNMMVAFSGEYVPPGPSGAPTRGNADILPMGRNYFGIDPDSVPSRSAWSTGVRMAEQMIERFVDEKGTYPHEIGFIIWATDTMKTNGDDLAYILWLMGVRPKWSRSGGQVIGLEVVPLKELGRPRIDVTVRITGLFRDTFPNLIDIIDDAVKLISELDEAEDENYLASNLRKDMVESIKNGLTVDEARRKSSVRVFGCPPGCYGPGVNHAIESGDWKTVQDLADIYVTWGSYGYGRGLSGVSMKDDFVKRFGNSEVTIKNMPDREIDIIDMDDVYGYLGGLNAFTRAYGRKDAISVIGDSSDPDNVRTRDSDEELKFIFRSKVLNPKFLDGLKKHGYRGVGELAKMTEFVFGWGATADIVDDWMYQGIAEKFLFDEDTKQWMEDENPYAMMDMTNRLLEAIDRGMWNADEDTKNKLRETFMDAEERVEEISDR